MKTSHIYLQAAMLAGCMNLFPGFQLSAQEKQQILTVRSLEEMIVLAGERNPDLESYQINQEVSKKNLRIAQGRHLPVLGATFIGQQNLDLATTPVPGEIFGQPGTVVEAQFGQEFNYNAGLSVNATLLDWGKHLQTRSARLNNELAGLKLEEFRVLLNQQVCLYYYSALVAKKAIELGERDKILADSLAMLADAKYRAGHVDRMSRNQAHIQLKSVSQNLLNSQTLYEQSLEELKILLGFELMEELILVEELGYALPPVIAENRLEPSQQIAMAEVRSLQAKTGVKSSLSAYVPQLGVNAYFGKQQFRDEWGLDFDDGAWTDYSFAGLTLNVPLFGGLVNHQQLQKSKLEMKLAEQDLRQTQSGMAIRDQQLINDYHRSLETTRLTRETMALHEENRSLSMEQFENGIISMDQQLRVSEDYLKSEIGFLNALLSTYQYYSQIQYRIQSP